MVHKSNRQTTVFHKNSEGGVFLFHVISPISILCKHGGIFVHAFFSRNVSLLLLMLFLFFYFWFLCDLWTYKHYSNVTTSLSLIVQTPLLDLQINLWCKDFSSYKLGLESFLGQTVQIFVQLEVSMWVHCFHTPYIPSTYCTGTKCAPWIHPSICSFPMNAVLQIFWANSWHTRCSLKYEMYCVLYHCFYITVLYPACLSGGGGSFPYGSRRGLADAYCQAGVSCPAWSLPGQDGRWASRPRHTAGGHINPCVSLCVSGGESCSCSGVPPYGRCLNTPLPILQHTHVRPPVELQCVDIHSASERGGTTTGRGNQWRLENRKWAGRNIEAI